MATASTAAIEESRMLVMGRIDTLAMEYGLVRQDLDKFKGRNTSAENHISDIEDTVATTAKT